MYLLYGKEKQDADRFSHLLKGSWHIFRILMFFTWILPEAYLETKIQGKHFIWEITPENIVEVWGNEMGKGRKTIKMCYYSGYRCGKPI